VRLKTGGRRKDEGTENRWRSSYTRETERRGYSESRDGRTELRRYSKRRMSEGTARHSDDHERVEAERGNEFENNLTATFLGNGPGRTMNERMYSDKQR
jgi:hypothetical protein